MNAVNLIPSDRRKRSTNVSASPATLGLIAGLLVALAAAVLYVFAVNDVRSRQGELTRVTANAASWQAAASSYSAYVTAAQQRTQQIADIRQLAAGRFPWSVLLSQIGGVMPADAALSSLQATSPSADATAATAAATGTPAATATGTPAAGAGTSAASTTQSAVSVAGCAASESAVAATMEALRRVNGIASVSLASATNNATPSGGSSSPSSSPGQSGTGCPFPIVFQMTLTLVVATPTTPATTPAAATPASTPAATPTPAASASAATSSTGAAQ